MRYALITGATSGIGIEIAARFVAAGWGVVLVSSSGEHLSDAHKKLMKIRSDSKIITITQDLSESGAAEQLYQAVHSIGIDIDALVNDAGFGLIGAAVNIPTDMEEKMMRLNMIAPVQLCKLFIRDMYARQHGVILNVASTGAFEPGPFNSTYYATKALKQRWLGVVISVLLMFTFGFAFNATQSFIISTSLVTLPFTTFRYGVSIKPYSLIRAYEAKFSTKPMLAPSGVSTTQIRP